MNHYLVHATYTSRAWAAQPASLAARRDAMQLLFERLGVRLDACYYAFNDHALVATVQLPASLSIAAFARALSASGVFAAMRTLPLTPVEDAIVDQDAAHRDEDTPRGMRPVMAIAGAAAVLFVVGLLLGHSALRGHRAGAHQDQEATATRRGMPAAGQRAAAPTLVFSPPPAAPRLYLVDSQEQAEQLLARLNAVTDASGRQQRPLLHAAAVVITSPAEAAAMRSMAAAVGVVVVDVRAAPASPDPAWLDGSGLEGCLRGMGDVYADVCAALGAH